MWTFEKNYNPGEFVIVFVNPDYVQDESKFKNKSNWVTSE